MSFCNLYIQTEYSLLNSSVKLDELIDKALFDKYQYLGIADLNTMHGVIKFYTKCLNANIKPIIGLALKLSCSVYDESDIYLLYARNEIGYKNLMKISTLINLKPFSEITDFKEYLNNLIIILPGLENESVRSLLKDDDTLFKNHKLLFDEFYLGLDFLDPLMRNNFDNLLSKAQSLDISCIALDKTSFLEKTDYKVYEVLRMIDKNSRSYIPTEKEINSYYKSKNTLFDIFRNYKELINNTIKVASECNLKIDFDNFHLPIYDDQVDSEKMITTLSLAGLKKRLIKSGVDKKLYNIYIERLNYELQIVSKMGFNDYFLIVYDFVKYAKKNDIIVGPGRGSAPGALLSYVLGITEIDPIKHQLLFERFLNPERISMPDIDTDFSDEKRDIVIKYMGLKYTKNRVAHISTFGTFGPRLAIRDICRVKNIDEIYLNELLKYITPYTKKIEDALENPSFKKMIFNNEVFKEVIYLAEKLENIPRNLSIHAAGIILADKDLIEYTPLLEGINGLYQTQYEASDLEKLGLVKIDFLGLKYLTMIEKIQKLIKETQKDFDINNININDSKTFEMLSKGDTTGVFQLESSGMRKTLTNVRIETFNDIVDVLALYRPGPMEMIPSFSNRKNGKEKITYYHQDLVNILRPTYGIIVYQEQILLIASQFAGYSLGEADILRRAVTKKQQKVLENEKEKFIQGAIKNGYQKEIASDIFDLILKFANYGFNKSHSVSYATIAYQLAYLKKHYPKEFSAIILSYTDKPIRSLILECYRNGIEVIPPSINISNKEFVIYNNNIYYSLLRINGVGATIILNIVSEREKNGLYASYDEFIRRTKDVLNKKTVEMLIYSGALDDFKIPRKQLVSEYDKSLQLANFGELFESELAVHEFKDDEYTFDEIAALERIALGYNLKYNIFRKYQDYRIKYKTTLLQDLKVGTSCNVMVVLESIKEIKTKTNTLMAFAILTDDTDDIDGVIFTDLYEKTKEKLVSGNLYILSVRIETRNDKMQAVILNIII